jgi:hypothetical protein
VVATRNGYAQSVVFQLEDELFPEVRLARAPLDQKGLWSAGMGKGMGLRTVARSDAFVEEAGILVLHKPECIRRKVNEPSRILWLRSRCCQLRVFSDNSPLFFLMGSQRLKLTKEKLTGTSARNWAQLGCGLRPGESTDKV